MENVIEAKYLQLLVSEGQIKKDDVPRFIKEAQNRKEPLTTYLIKEKIVSDQEIEDYLSREFGVQVIDPFSVEVQEEVKNLIDPEVSKKYGVVPISFEGQVLSVAAVNPMDIIMLDDLRALVGFGVKALYCLPLKLEEAYYKIYNIERVIEESEDVDIEDIIAEAQADDLEVVEDKIDDSSFDLLQQAEETPIIRITNLILTDGIKRGASDIFIEPWDKYMTVRCRVDGLLEQLKPPPKSMANSIVSRIKVLSHLDIAERRAPQDGRFRIKYQDRFVEFRVSVLPSSFGEKVCMRILDKKARSQALDKLGFQESELERIKEAASKPHGMILVTGPTGSGKTSTLYSVLAHIDSPDKNITTVEDPVEYQLYGINQVNIRENVGLTFSAALRSILRQDPDVIMVGEIRDFITMDIAIKAALTGHLVLSTLHTNDACGSIVRMTNMGIEPFLIASSLLMVSAQRLLRQLCSECKEGYEPSEKLFKDLKLSLDTKATFYKPAGCEHCRSTGFSGRTVITEVLPISEKVKELIMINATAEEIKKVGRDEGMTTLRESGVMRIVAGMTSVDEVLRVTAADQF